jgi:hypothetical protein
MSKAFTKEDDGGDEVLVPYEPPWPPGARNYVTAAGHARLRAEREALAVRPASALTPEERRRLAVLGVHLEAAEVVAPAPAPPPPLCARRDGYSLHAATWVRLVERFRAAVDAFSGDARAEDLPRYVRNLHRVERDFLLVPETEIELPDWIGWEHEIVVEKVTGTNWGPDAWRERHSSGL